MKKYYAEKTWFTYKATTDRFDELLQYFRTGI